MSIYWKILAWFGIILLGMFLISIMFGLTFLITDGIKERRKTERDSKKEKISGRTER